MSPFDQLAADAAEVMVEFMGEREQVTFHPPAAGPFKVDAILGEIEGAEFRTDTDQTAKLLRARLEIPRRAFRARAITEMPMMAKVDAYGLAGWTINLAESKWGESWVRLAIERETLVREYQARRNATV